MTAPWRAITGLVAGAESRIGRSAAASGWRFPATSAAGTGLIKNANSTWLNGKPFARDLEAALGRAVRLANDANCFALVGSDRRRGGGRRASCSA